MRYLLAFAITMFVSVLTLRGQDIDKTFSVDYLGPKEGLSHRWLRTIYKDSRGIFWIGAYNGLNRYDGNNIIVYRPSDDHDIPISADNIYNIAEDDNGILYIASLGGIFRFDPYTGKFKQILAAKENESILIDNKGRGAPILTTGHHLQANNHGNATLYQLTKQGRIVKILQTENLIPENLYIVDFNDDFAWFWDFKGSYHRFDLKNNAWGKIPIRGSVHFPSDEAGRLWLPEHSQLKPYILPKHLETHKFITFHIEAGKAVWLYSEQSFDEIELYRLDLISGETELCFPFLSKNDLYDIKEFLTNQPAQLLDDENTLWFTGFLGMFKVRRTNTLFTRFLAKTVTRVDVPPTGISARQIIEDIEGNIYVLNSFKNIQKLNNQGSLIEEIKIPSWRTRVSTAEKQNMELELNENSKKLMDANFVMLDGHDGYIWLLTPTGLSRYNYRTKVFKHYSLNIFNQQLTLNLFDDGHGNIIAQKADTLILFNKKTEQVSYKYVPGDNTLLFGTMLPEENTLLGYTDKSLLKINTKNFEVSIIPIFKDAREMRCIVSYKGWLWAGTSKGLAKIDPKTFSYTLYDRTNGLADNYIYSIIAVDDYLWIGTSDGLSRFNVITNEVRNFYVEDGLSHNEFNSFSTLRGKNGRIYMGGLNGVNAFFSEDLKRKKHADSKILLSQFNIFDTKNNRLKYLEMQIPLAEIDIQPSVSSFSLHLALTNYIDPSKNQFAWQIDGLDNHWIYAGNQNVATFRHIPPGKYTFRAKAADSFGKWSSNELAIHINVLRPWYFRWWAIMGYVGAIIGLAYWFYRFQVGRKIEEAETRRLHELDEFKNRFYTNMTHEFRTPLTVIMGTAQNVISNAEALSPGVIKEKAGLINRNSQSLLYLINQILDLTKLENNKLEAQYIQGDVVSYIRYISESMHSYANSRNVMLKVESNTPSVLMDYDPERLRQILHNLLSNAIKFTPSGGLVLLRTLLKDQGNRSGMIIEINDSGVGISREELPYIFDRFYQAKNSDITRAGGTGIGLSLANQLVSLMGGNINVQSAPGKGTSFHLWFPINNRAEMVIFVPDKSDESLTVPDISPQDDDPAKPHLLLIEDNPDVMLYLSDCLSPSYQLDYAYNGRAGIEKALETSHDLIVSDVMMPEKDGFEVCQTLKNDVRTSHIPIILLTARVDATSRIAGMRRGADAYMGKPFNREELLATIHNLLDLRETLRMKYLESAVAPTITATPPSNTAEPHGHKMPEAEENEFLHRLRTIVEAHLDDTNLNVEVICRNIGMGRTNLYNKLKALTGLTVSLYIRKIRLYKAMELLKSSDFNVSEVAYKVGFNDPKYFSRVFAEEFEMPPNQIKRHKPQA